MHSNWASFLSTRREGPNTTVTARFWILTTSPYPGCMRRANLDHFSAFFISGARIIQRHGPSDVSQEGKRRLKNPLKDKESTIREYDRIFSLLPIAGEPYQCYIIIILYFYVKHANHEDLFSLLKGRSHPS